MVFKEKKGQSALEYLMTYGWALVVIVIVVAALVFLINPQQIGTEGCTGFQKLLISDFDQNTDALAIKVSNQTGKTLSAVTFTGTFNGGALQASDYTGATVAANEEFTVTFNNAGAGLGLTAGAVKADLGLRYNDGFANRDANATCNATA
ncbi:MAG: hypothetical protein COV47_02805 [Candidatus Diapherotrites archaeon CG11_big_fil_rev_8_21_14_0_20_37_9]|nr:MAG: hypothetical protein COV47_02805 [Candidatus Diapherotrites archaeon CG11_big_fil_rev_8_21_14_0_20_37_9]